MKKILSVVFLSGLSMLVHGQALRIMPLGNSITQSENTHLSYRYNLWVKLKASGISFDFVGSLNTNFNGNPTFPDPTFDKDHEGHWGWRADELFAGLPTWLQGYTPDIVLMHVGTNDLFQGQTIASTVSEIKSIIDLVRGDNPNVTILLAQLIGTSGATNNSAIVQLNNQMSAIANEKNTAASKVIVVDQYTGFDPVVDTFDGVHPDASGEEKMAQKWFDAISALTSPADSEAPTVPGGLTSSNVTQTGFTLSWTASADAVGVTGYDVLLNGTSIGTPSETMFNVTGLAPATVYSMRVRARDLAGNWSALSNALSVTTLASDGLRSFYRAVNVNGTALTIDGNNWVSSAGAPNFSITTNLWGFENQSVPLIPPTDASRATMIRSSIFGNTVSIAMSAVPNATYDVWLYVWEDNSPETYSVSLEGTVMRSNFNSGAAGTWTKLGPFTRTISDGTINIVTQGGHANVSGVEVFTTQTQAAARMSTGGVLAAEVSLADEEDFQDRLRLSTFPNPSEKEVVISFTAAESAVTDLAIYDPRGRKVVHIFKGSIVAGQIRKFTVDTTDLLNGLYIITVVNGHRIERRKHIVAH